MDAHCRVACNQPEGPLSRTWLDESTVRKTCRVGDIPAFKAYLLFTVPHPKITLTGHRGRSIPGTSVRSADSWWTQSCKRHRPNTYLKKKKKFFICALYIKSFNSKSHNALITNTRLTITFLNILLKQII